MKHPIQRKEKRTSVQENFAPLGQKPEFFTVDNVLVIFDLLDVFEAAKALATERPNHPKLKGYESESARFARAFFEILDQELSRTKEFSDRGLRVHTVTIVNNEDKNQISFHSNLHHRDIDVDAETIWEKLVQVWRQEHPRRMQLFGKTRDSLILKLADMAFGNIRNISFARDSQHLLGQRYMVSAPKDDETGPQSIRCSYALRPMRKYNAREKGKLWQYVEMLKT